MRANSVAQPGIDPAGAELRVEEEMGVGEDAGVEEARGRRGEEPRVVTEQGVEGGQGFFGLGVECVGVDGGRGGVFV